MVKTLQLTNTSTLKCNFPTNMAKLIQDRRVSHATPHSACNRAFINLSKVLINKSISAIEQESMTLTEKAYFYREISSARPDNPSFMMKKSETITRPSNKK